jgi:hypothetical protein
VAHGILENVEIFGDFFELKPVIGLAEKLNGSKFTKKDIENALSDADKFILNANGKEIADKLF